MIEQQFARLPQNPLSTDIAFQDAATLINGKAAAEIALQGLLTQLDPNHESGLTGNTARAAMLELLLED
jgi:hypothetical protein